MILLFLLVPTKPPALALLTVNFPVTSPNATLSVIVVFPKRYPPKPPTFQSPASTFPDAIHFSNVLPSSAPVKPPALHPVSTTDAAALLFVKVLELEYPTKPPPQYPSHITEPAA